MTDSPTIKISGAGTRHMAAGFGRDIVKGVSAAVATRNETLHIDTLRVRLPANADARELEQAIRAALAKKERRR